MLFSAGVIKRPIAVTSWCIALVLAGFWAALDIPIEFTPNTELPQVRISASWPGASPRQIERYVTAVIEREVQTVPGIAKISSVSSENTSFVSLEVDEEVDLSAFATQVGEKLALLRSELPDRVVPHLTKEVPEAFRDIQGFMTIQVVGPYTPDQLRELADETLKPQFQSLPGVDMVEVAGGSERELLIVMDPDLLDTYGIDPNRVQGVLREALADDVFGRMDVQGRGHLLTSKAELDIAGLSAIIVSESMPGEVPVRLDQVASIGLGPAPLRSISRIDGDPVVIMDLERTRGTHMIDVAESVHDRIEEMLPLLPEGVRMLVAMDRTEDVRELLDDLTWRGGTGLILVIFVLLFMLKSVRSTLVVLFSVAVALAPALALFRLFDLTLNIITLAGLVLVFGLLVDNSVIVVEQLQHQQRKLNRSGLEGVDLLISRAQAALKAVWLPLLGGTLSTMAVMLPLVYLSGDLRDLFLPFGILVSLTLLISLVSAAFVVPVLARFLPVEAQRIHIRWLRRWMAVPYRVVARFPKVSFAILILILGTPFWKLPMEISDPVRGWSTPSKERFANVYNATLGSDRVQSARGLLDPLLGGVMKPFFQTASFYKPYSYPDRRSINVAMSFPPGNIIERADSLIARFEKIALASESVYRTLLRVTETRATMRVEFNVGSMATPEPYLVQQRLVSHAILLGGMSVYVTGLIPNTSYSSSGGMGMQGERVQMFGPNYEDLDALANQFSDFLKGQSRRVMAVDVNGTQFRGSSSAARQVLRFQWDGDAQARTGASAWWIRGRLQPYFHVRHRFAAADIAGDTQVPIRLVVDQAGDIDVDRVIQRPLAMADSALIKLDGLGGYEIVEMPSEIEREDQQYKRYLTVDYRGPFQMAREFVSNAIETFPVPPGYRLEHRTGYFFTDETREAFSWIFLATLLLVFLVTAAIFESWKLPFVVMLSVPLAGVGVFVGFLITGASFVEGAFIGTVLLIGIAVNDSILLTDRFRQLRIRRPYGKPAILARLAVRERLRPMWTTTLTSAAAMLPLLVFPDHGDFWTGLAVTVTAGLFAATLLTPFASVAMLSMFKARPVPAE